MIGFLSYNSDSPDSFQFITLSPIDTDQVIHFTDNGVTSTGNFRANEGIITWTAPSGGLPPDLTFRIRWDQPHRLARLQCEIQWVLQRT